MFDNLQYPYAILAALALSLLFWRPVAGLVLIAAIYPMDPFSPRLPVPGLNTETVLLGVAFAITVLRFGARLPPLRYSGPVVAFIAVTGMAFMIALPWASRFSIDDGTSAVWFIFKFWKSVTFSALLFFATYWWFAQPADRQHMLEALSVGVFISCVAWVADYVLILTPIAADGRAAGLQGDPNDMAAAIGSMMFVPLYLAVRGIDLSGVRRLFHAGVYALSFLAVVFSLSRGNWVALIAAHAVFLFLMSRALFFAAIASVAIVVTVGFPLLPKVVRDRIEVTTSADRVVYNVPLAVGLEGSAATRVVFARIGADMLARSPLWGNGLNAFYFRTPEFGAKYGMLNFKDPHNLVVKFAAESGLIGIAALTWLIWAVFRCGRRLWRSDSSEFRLGAVLLASGTHVLIANLSTDAFLSTKQVSAYFWILYALSARAYVGRLSADETAPQPVAVPRWRRFSQRASAAASQL